MPLLFKRWKEASGELSWKDLAEALAAVGRPELARPDHVTALARALADALEAKRVLDPFSAAPLFTAGIAESESVQEVIGITPVEEVPQHLMDPRDTKVQWVLGYPWDVLNATEVPLDGFDVVLSSPPAGMKLPEDLPDAVLGPMGRSAEAAYWVINASAHRATRLAAFHVTDGFFSQRQARDLRERLADGGLHLSAAISLSRGFGEATNVPTSFVVFSREPQFDLFVGRLTPGQDPRRLVENLMGRTEGKAPETGLLVDLGSYRGWGPLQAKIDLQRQLRVPAEQLRPLEDVATAITPLRLRKGEEHQATANAIYLYQRSNQVTLEPPDPPTKERSVFRAYEVALDPEVVEARFAVWWLSSPPGQLSRSALSTGGFIPHLTASNVGQVRVVVPPLDDQKAAVVLHERLAALQGEVASLETELATRPQAALELEEQLDAYWSDPFETWAAQLPFPLASIIDRYIADTGTETQIERLLQFFEAFAEFVVAVLLGAVHQDRTLWEQRRGDISEPAPDGTHPLERSTFGGWIHLGFLLAKIVRTALEEAEDRGEARRALLGVSHERFEALASPKLLNALDQARKARNRLHHGEITTPVAKRELLGELRELLVSVREATERCFARVVLLVPGPDEFDGEIHSHERCRRLRGPSANFRIRPFESLVQLKGRSMYFVDDVARVSSALEVTPLFRLMETPRGEENACFFAAGRNRDGRFKFISYHATVDATQLQHDPSLQRLLDDMS